MRAYYFTVSYNGYKQGQLLDIKTKSFVRAKHCAPILNVTKIKITMYYENTQNIG